MGHDILFWHAYCVLADPYADGLEVTTPFASFARTPWTPIKRALAARLRLRGEAAVAPAVYTKTEDSDAAQPHEISKTLVWCRHRRRRRLTVSRGAVVESEMNHRESVSIKRRDASLRTQLLRAR